jgi:hypothetical protein
VSEQETPVEWRYPDAFRGAGVRGHRFHVLAGEKEDGGSEPWYYKPGDVE